MSKPSRITLHDPLTRSVPCSSVVADSIVDVLLLDHGRLQEMDLASEVIDQILLHAPEYLDERKVACQKVQTARGALMDDFENAD